MQGWRQSALLCFLLVWGTLLLLSSSPAVSFEVEEYLGSAEYNFGDSVCPYNCSNRGACNLGTQTCNCTTGYGGTGCQYAYNSLSKGNPLAGSLSNTTRWAYFSYSPGQNDNFLRIQLNTTSTNNGTSAQLFAKFVGSAFVSTSWPRTDYYDFKDLVDALSETITINAPRLGLWVIGVYNLHSSAFSFNISATSSVQCPNNCSNGNGACNQATGVCACNANYTLLPDCSQYSIKMQNNATYNMTLQPGQWAFYILDVSNQNSINVSLNDTTSGSQSVLLRLYASASSFPTPYSYSYVASVATQSLQIQNVSTSLYYFGVYFPVTTAWLKPANFTLQATASVTCPNACSGQGTCQSNPVGVCQCSANRGLPDCSEVDVPMSSGTSYTDTLSPRNWAYYKLPVTNQNQIVVVANEVDSFGNLALYARKGAKPSLYTYDMVAPVNSTGAHTLQITNVASNSPYYFGVYAISQVQYNVKSIATVSCPNGCSGNGVCINGACNCSANWTSLVDCSQFNIVMSNGQNYTHNVTAGMTHYYQIYVVSANQLVFDVNITASNTPLTVVVQYGTMPTLYSYQAISNSTDLFHRIEIAGIASAQQGTWYMAIFNSGNSTALYSTQGFALRICPNECSGNGQCQGGICNCKPTYTNYDCSSEEIEIASSVEVSGVVHAAQWNFYHINVLGSNALHVKVTELSTIGKVWLYMLKGDGGETFPTQNRHTFTNKSDTAEHEIFIPSVNSTGTWFIGCFGSPYLGFNEPQAEYSIIALVGCNDYKQCDSCVQDPNCGWCADDSLDPEHGFCTSGNSDKPFNNKCVAWLFSECSVKKVQTQSALIGVVIGISVGGGVGLILLALALILYKRRNYYLKKNSYSPFDVTIISDDEDNAEEYIGGSRREYGDEDAEGDASKSGGGNGGGWKQGLSSLFHNMSSSFGKLPDLAHENAADNNNNNNTNAATPGKNGKSKEKKVRINSVPRVYDSLRDGHGEGGNEGRHHQNGSQDEEDEGYFGGAASSIGDTLTSPPIYSSYLQRRRLDEEGFFSDKNREHERDRERDKEREKEKEHEEDDGKGKGKADKQYPEEGEYDPILGGGEVATATWFKRNSGEYATRPRASTGEGGGGGGSTTTHTAGTSTGKGTNTSEKRSSWFPWNVASSSKPAPDPSITSSYESIDGGYHSD